MGCHNEAGLRSGDRLIECIQDFIHSKYNVMLIQEHKLDRKGGVDAKSFCEARGIAATFESRADEAAREGTAIMIKLRPLALQSSDVAFETCADGRCTVASFTCMERKERVASVYLPTRPSERITTIRQIRDSKILRKSTVVGGDHNCVPNLLLDAHRGYENAHAREWESYLSSLGLEDVTRTQEGHVRGPYTRMPSDGTYTRIDRILARTGANTQHTSGVDEAFGYSASRTSPDHKTIYVSR